MRNHKIEKKDNTTVSNIIVVLIAIGIIFSIYLITRFESNPKTTTANLVKNSPVSYDGDTQYIDMTAKGGFSPENITAKANQKTILRVNTSNTFDCSSSIAIPKLSYRANLPPSGTTEIKIPPQETNAVINGTCSMGMYRFSIKFI